MMLDLDSREVKWRPPIKRTIASKDEGVDELVEALDEHFEFLEDSDELTVRRQDRTRNEIIAMINEQIGRRVADVVVASDDLIAKLTLLTSVKMTHIQWSTKSWQMFKNLMIPAF